MCIQSISTFTKQIPAHRPVALQQYLKFVQILICNSKSTFVIVFTIKSLLTFIPLTCTKLKFVYVHVQCLLKTVFISKNNTAMKHRSLNVSK